MNAWMFSQTYTDSKDLYLICSLTTGMKSVQPKASTRKIHIFKALCTFPLKKSPVVKQLLTCPNNKTAFLSRFLLSEVLFPMTPVNFYKVSNPQGSLNIHAPDIYYPKSHHILLFESLKSMLGSTTSNTLLTGTIVRYQGGKLLNTNQGWKLCDKDFTCAFGLFYSLFTRKIYQLIKSDVENHVEHTCQCWVTAFHTPTFPVWLVATNWLPMKKRASTGTPRLNTPTKNEESVKLI